ncbi:glycosyltransferase family 39 protein [Effusibacillus pohliae]|uniref:glycosyltransferase family 39 protein n=1 Tax=Effusibacillus pohliae TaxID=232270 RepID=UPI0003645139|nr:glycosyltransferase family 39 protein [Effusibacillus pohliae]
MKPTTRLQAADAMCFAFITAIGAILRYLWIVHVPNVPESDFLGYYKIAESVYHDQGISLNGNPVAFQGMAYPLVLGLCFKAIGQTGLIYAKYLNVALSVLTMAVLFFIYWRLFPNKKWTYAAYVATALLPNYIAYTSVVGTEILFTLFLSVTLLLQLSNFDKRLRYPLLGVFIAFASLTRPFFIAYPAAFAAAEWIRSKSVRETAIATLSVSLVMAAVIAPWTYRNYQTFHLFIPVSHNGGYVLFINNNDYNWHGGWLDPQYIQVSDEFKQKFVERGTTYPEHPPQTDELYKEAAKQWIFSHPIEFLQLGTLRLKNTFFNGAADIEKWTMNQLRQPSHGVRFERTLNLFLSFSSVVVYLLSSFGFVYTLLNLKRLAASLFRKSSAIGFGTTVVTLNIAFFSAVYFVTEGQPRYNFPVLLFFIIATVSYIGVLARESGSQA